MRGTLRQRLTVSVVGITAVMLALLVIGFNWSLRNSLDGDINRLLEARAQTTLGGIDFENGKLAVHSAERQEDEETLVWVFAANPARSSPATAGPLERSARQLAIEGEGTIDDPTGEMRLRAEPVIRDGERVGTVVTGVSLEPYRDSASRALGSSIVLALIMLALTAVTTRLVVGRALKPVSDMTREAAEWSEHDLDRRFNEGEPTDELTRLAATFDTMLDRMAFMVRHERNFSAELSHELRTPLAAISAEAEIALRRDRDAGEYREAVERIARRSAELTSILETLLDVARAEGGSQPDQSVDLHEAALDVAARTDTLAKRYRTTVTVEREAPGIRAQIGAESFQRALVPIVENALAYADSRVTLTARTGAGRMVEVLVADDGPGFSEADAAAAFEPGRRGSAPRNPQAPPGTGLGLALARRLARANGGDVAVLPSATGARVCLSLPAALDAEFRTGTGNAAGVDPSRRRS